MEHKIDARPHVVILGGGFGGMNAASSLRHAPVRITLVDKHNHHLFQPLLYQVATAALNPSDIAYPIRRIFRNQRNVTPILAEAKQVLPEAKKVILVDGELSYDFLIVATGATHSYFGHDEWQRYAPGLKNIEDARAIRSRMLRAFEYAERETDPAKAQDWLNFVIVGGGPTGVELAGAFIEIARHTLSEDFRHIDPRKARVVLLEGTDRILQTFSPATSKKAEEQLRALGVEVRTKTRVTGIDGEGIWVGQDRIRARNVIWAAGVAASPLGRSLGVSLDKAGRVPVLPDLTISGHPEIFVIGDLAAFTQDGETVPGVAPVAIQEGKQVAQNIRRRLDGESYKPFRYFDKGMMATIGRAAAVAEIGKLRLSGFIAWMAWLFIHILYLIGFRNRLIVLFDWAWVYFTYERGARLITGDDEAQESVEKIS